MRLDYDVVDVFTDRAFAGNPLAIVYGAGDLSTASLHAIAREFNLSETTFPTAPSEIDRASGIDYRVRIFTPGGEIPFAGHPTLGTAWALRERGLLSPGERTQSCAAGLIGVTVSADATSPLELAAPARDLSAPLSKEAVAAVAECVGLTAGDVIGPAYAAGCGLSFLHLRVQPAALPRARPGTAPLRDLALGDLELRDPLEGVNVFTVAGSSPAGRSVEGDSVLDSPVGTGSEFGAVGTDSRADGSESGAARGPLEIRSRVFVPGLSVAEDPATGSSAVGLGVALVALGVAGAEGATSYRITQGVEMGRPSLLHGRIAAERGRALMCWVAGQVVPVATGSIVVPLL